MAVPLFVSHVSSQMVFVVGQLILNRSAHDLRVWPAECRSKLHAIGRAFRRAIRWHMSCVSSADEQTRTRHEAEGTPCGHKTALPYSAMWTPPMNITMKKR